MTLSNGCWLSGHCDQADRLLGRARRSRHDGHLGMIELRVRSALPVPCLVPQLADYDDLEAIVGGSRLEDEVRGVEIVNADVD